MRDQTLPAWSAGKRYLLRGSIKTFAVDQAIKGVPSRQLRYFDEYSSAQFWDEKSKRYLLFFRQRPGKNELYIDTCGNSDELGRIGPGVARMIGQLSGKVIHRGT